MQTHDQTVLITGGSSGIGLALVRKFAQANRVIAVGRDQQRLEALRAELPAVEIASADLTDPQAIAKLPSAREPTPLRCVLPPISAAY